jgi:hypothetical protein
MWPRSLSTTAVVLHQQGTDAWSTDDEPGCQLGLDDFIHGSSNKERTVATTLEEFRQTKAYMKKKQHIDEHLFQEGVSAEKKGLLRECRNLHD